MMTAITSRMIPLIHRHRWLRPSRAAPRGRLSVRRRRLTHEPRIDKRRLPTPRRRIRSIRRGPPATLFMRLAGIPPLPRSAILGRPIPATHQASHAPLPSSRVPSGFKDLVARAVHPDQPAPTGKTFHEDPGRADLLSISFLSQRRRFLSLGLDLGRVLVRARQGRDERLCRRFLVVMVSSIIPLLFPSLSLTFPDPFPSTRIGTPQRVVVRPHAGLAVRSSGVAFEFATTTLEARLVAFQGGLE